MAFKLRVRQFSVAYNPRHRIDKDLLRVLYENVTIKIEAVDVRAYEVCIIYRLVFACFVIKMYRNERLAPYVTLNTPVSEIRIISTLKALSKPIVICAVKITHRIHKIWRFLSSFRTFRAVSVEREVHQFQN